MSNEKVWFITELSEGFGLPLVKSLLSNGHRVAVISGTDSVLRPHKQSLASHTGKLLPLTADLISEDSVASAVRQTIGRFGRIDIVINNAGMFGSFHVLKQVIPYLQDQHSGHIINFSSSCGPLLTGAEADACQICTATKLAIESLSEALIADARDAGVKVSHILSGAEEPEDTEPSWELDAGSPDHRPAWQHTGRQLLCQ